MQLARMFLASVFLAGVSPLPAQVLTLDSGPNPPGVSVSDADQTVRIRQEGSVKVRPDTLYMLMKVENEAARLDQALDQNKKAVDGFVAALAGLKIDHSAIRVASFIVSPTMLRSGVSFARNVIITVPNIDQKPATEIDRLMAGVQDLGARFGSQCVTCIGSG